MATIYVARSKALGDWGYDVGLGKHIYKVGLTDAAIKEVVAAGWAGEKDWSLVKKQDGVEGVTEDDVIDRLAARVKMIDPKLYPRIRETRGIFKIVPAQVENSLIVAKALAGDGDISQAKIKPADIGQFLIANGLA
jgi:hypothetical protein